MLETGYYFLYKLPDSQEILLLKPSTYKLERLQDALEGFILSSLAFPSQQRFLQLLQERPSLFLDIYKALKEPTKESSLEVEIEILQDTDITNNKL